MHLYHFTYFRILLIYQIVPHIAQSVIQLPLAKSVLPTPIIMQLLLHAQLVSMEHIPQVEQ